MVAVSKLMVRSRATNADKPMPTAIGVPSAMSVTKVPSRTRVLSGSMIAGRREGGFDRIEQNESARQREREIDIAALEVERGRRLSQSERRVHESEATDDEDEHRECCYARGDDELEDAVSGEKLDGQVRSLSETVARSGREKKLDVTSGITM